MIQSVAENNLDLIKEHTSEGLLRLIHVVGVPRSVSTALGRALNESEATSVFINEPFSREISEPDEVARVILETIAPVIATTHQPVIVITKNMASYLSAAAYREMSQLADATVWSVRDPLIQMGSLITRLANDIHIENGADSITQRMLTSQMLKEVCDLLLDSRRSKNFSKTGWASMGEHWRSANTTKRSVVVDGEEFTANPAALLTALCSQIDLHFSPRMVQGWQRDYTNVINSGNIAETTRSAWTSHAALSVGVAAVSRSALDLSQLPIPLRKHIEEVAIPTYREMTK